MSGPPAPDPEDLLADPGLLTGAPLLEFGACRLGQAAVTPWRRDWRASGGRAVGLPAELPPGTWEQAAVRIGRGRAATQADLAEAWARVRPGGRIAIAGPNELGAAAWERRLRGWCGAGPLAASARAHQRAAAFLRGDGPGPPPPPAQRVPADTAPGAPLLTVPAGVFSGDGLDAGTAVLLGHLATRPPARRILDLGCGAGHLGLWCLRHWPGAEAVLADADARAVAGAAANAAALGVAARCAWWDDAEPAPATACDLVLLNPPAHAGERVDLAAAQGLIRRAGEALAPGGRLLLVANRRLPYERELAGIGATARAAEADGYKVLEAIR